MPELGPIAARDGAEQRHCARITSRPRRSSASSAGRPSAPSRTRSIDLCRAFRAGRIPTRSTTSATTTSRRFRRRAWPERCRAPSSPAERASSAATWSICWSTEGYSGRRDRQPGHRADARISRSTRRDPRVELRTVDMCALAPDDAAVPRRRLCVPLRRHRRHRAVDRAAARLHAGQRRRHARGARGRAARRACASSSTRPRRRATGSPPSCRPRRRPPIRPEYPYALSKYLGESAALHWAQVYRLPVISIRMFNVYGPRVRTTGAYGAVFGVFLAQKLHGKPFTVVGDGTQPRDFVFVTDVARAFLLAAESAETARSSTSGAGDPQTVNRLVELIGGDVVHLPKRPGEPDCTWADIGKIQRRARLGARGVVRAGRRGDARPDRGLAGGAAVDARERSRRRPTRGSSTWRDEGRLPAEDEDARGAGARPSARGPAHEDASSCATGCSTSSIRDICGT